MISTASSNRLSLLFYAKADQRDGNNPMRYDAFFAIVASQAMEILLVFYYKRYLCPPSVLKCSSFFWVVFLVFFPTFYSESIVPLSFSVQLLQTQGLQKNYRKGDILNWSFYFEMITVKSRDLKVNIFIRIYKFIL